MNVIEAMEARHSVRSYQNKPIEEEKAQSAGGAGTQMQCGKRAEHPAVL